MWKQLTCPLLDGWVNKLWYIHTMEYYLALERKEILQYATTRRNLEDIMLNEINQSQKDKYYMIPLILGTQNNQNHRDRM